MDNYFARLNQVNVSEHIEKKGNFSYLSWPYAVAQLRLADPSASWEVRRFEGLPYLRSETGYFVEVAVTVQGCHAVADPPGTGRQEPADLRADGVRHQHLDPALSGQGDRTARARPLHLRRRGSAGRAARQR